MNNNEQQKTDSHSNSVNKTPCDETNLLVNSTPPVLLQTAVIDVFEGSYISKQIREQLNLPTKGSTNVSISVFVCENRKSEIHDLLKSIYKLKIKTKF